MPDVADTGWATGLGRRAVVLAGRGFTDAKTAHGLLRRSPRFDVVAVVDPSYPHATTALAVPDGTAVPVVATVDAVTPAAEVAIVGIASFGGAIPAEVRPQLADALEAGIDVISGLHEQVLDDPDLAALASSSGSRVVELRAPRPFHELRFWTGAILDVSVPRLAVLGTDCDTGKRTTMFKLVDELEARGLAVEVVATGQTGLLQGARQGFVLDAMPLDFISGELEAAIIAAAGRGPDLIVVQGQGSFRGTTGQVGPQLLAHTGVSHVVLHHAPARRHYKRSPAVAVGDPAVDVALTRLYGAEPIALTLNAVGVATVDRVPVAADLGRRTGLPVIWTLEDGPGPLADLVERDVLGRSGPAVVATSSPRG